MGDYDFRADYDGVGKPETEMPDRFLCDGVGGDSTCDFGYADWPPGEDGTPATTVAVSHLPLDVLKSVGSWCQGQPPPPRKMDRGNLPHAYAHFSLIPIHAPFSG